MGLALEFPIAPGRDNSRDSIRLTTKPKRVRVRNDRKRSEKGLGDTCVKGTRGTFFGGAMEVGVVIRVGVEIRVGNRPDGMTESDIDKVWTELPEGSAGSKNQINFYGIFQKMFGKISFSIFVVRFRIVVY